VTNFTDGIFKTVPKLYKIRRNSNRRGQLRNNS